jgi:hypothetical protein
VIFFNSRANEEYPRLRGTVMIPAEGGHVQFALCLMNCVVSRIPISCERANYQTTMAASLSEHFQCLNLRKSHFSVTHWLCEDDKWFEVGVDRLNLINKGGMEDPIPFVCHKLLECCRR